MPLKLRPFFGVPRVRFYSSGQRFPKADILRDTQRQDTVKLDLDKPVVLKNWFSDLPAIAKWFTPSPMENGFHELNTTYLEAYGFTLVPLEMTRSSSSLAGLPLQSSFERFEAPLSILLSQMTGAQESAIQLYLAQCSLADLPSDLQTDLPTPDVISRVGKGDIYGSSLWLGRPPTRTPLHRDPNPNLFVQLAGKKVVRMMKPKDGLALYERLQEGGRHANMRGEEMMAGTETERLEDAVWSDKEGGTVADGVQAELESGDGLFIPLGWWHSVRGVGSGANASVNWWFR
ncbi:hypothetical protein BDV95DRAFT_497103 [Massariosphaeria phaeospora]|uniref:JmjC domain-containing protein n=1 Tax=Massariosphaeria phaeospora TaxID=100035 RepID=A0A7C8M6A6_9PLEO|nr:hypothetical protein BDV95DRAFT_497103 [Massariosphaeria phaeospora]